MLPSYLLALREGLEAALIIGIVIGALRKVGRPDLKPWAWAGTVSAAALSLIVAVVLNITGAKLEGDAEIIFEGFAMVTAAVLLTWMIFWMHNQSRHIKSDIETGVRRVVVKNDGWGLFFLAALAVLREGIELALFLLAARLTSNPAQTAIGAVLGLGSAALLGVLLFVSTRRLNLQRFFQVTNVLLVLFAAGLVAHGVHEFNEIGWIPAVIAPVWDINFILSEDSLLGQALKALLGYNGNPSLTEVLAYGLYFGAIALGLRLNATLQSSAAQRQASEG